MTFDKCLYLRLHCLNQDIRRFCRPEDGFVPLPTAHSTPGPGNCTQQISLLTAEGDSIPGTTTPCPLTHLWTDTGGSADSPALCEAV